MSIFSEIQKLKKSKSDIRKAIQQNGSNMSTDSNLVNYSVAIDNFDDNQLFDLTGVPTYNKNSYTQMVLPDTISHLRDNAFQGNTSLKELVLNYDGVVTVGQNIFRNTQFENGDGKIYVPDTLVTTYQGDTFWSNYNIFPLTDFVVNNEELYPLETLDRHLTVGSIENLTVGEILRK